jgi:hypothetical protein
VRSVELKYLSEAIGEHLDEPPEQAWIDLAFQALREFFRKPQPDLEWSGVQANVLDQACFVAGQDRGATDIFPESFAFPFKVGLASLDCFACKRERVLHAASDGVHS